MRNQRCGKTDQKDDLVRGKHLEEKKIMIYLFGGGVEYIGEKETLIEEGVCVGGGGCNSLDYHM